MIILIITSVSDKPLSSSGDYRKGFCYCALNNLSTEYIYTIIFSTFEPETIADFFYTISSTVSFNIKLHPEEGSGMNKMTIHGSWTSIDSIGNLNQGRAAYSRNPKYKLDLSCPGSVWYGK